MRRIGRLWMTPLAAAILAGTIACPPDRQGEPKTAGEERGNTARTGPYTGGREPAPGGGSTPDRPPGERSPGGTAGAAGGTGTADLGNAGGGASPGGGTPARGGDPGR